MNNDEFYEFEDRAYVNPTLSSGEQESFINSLRDIQGQNNAQIAEQTYNLGTAIPSNLGGLGGGEAYFTSRYQTPQVGEMVSNLKAAAQAQALNDVLSNYQNQLQNRYKQAYRKYQSRERSRARNSGNNLSDLLSNLLGGNTTQGALKENNISRNKGVLGAGEGIAASPSDVPDGQVYSTVYSGAVDANGNPITGKGTTTYNSRGNTVWSDDPTNSTNITGGSTLFGLPTWASPVGAAIDLWNAIF